MNSETRKTEITTISATCISEEVANITIPQIKSANEIPPPKFIVHLAKGSFDKAIVLIILHKAGSMLARIGARCY